MVVKNHLHSSSDVQPSRVEHIIYLQLNIIVREHKKQNIV